jgi:hypothetical protein
LLCSIKYNLIAKMSWNGNVGNPNWAGNDNEDGNVDVGDLYIVPTPATITENPSIGLEERNEVLLPTKYKDFDVANLTATDIQADDITADNITTTNLTATNINGNPNFDASNWSLYPAISNVVGTLGAFSVPLYSISDFLNITCANNITSQLGSITAALQISAGVSVGAPLGTFTAVNAESVQVSLTNETAAVDIYGANLLAGNNALYVEGGTTLTGGGVVHGVVIGALQVAGIDTVRIDVLPVGMTLTSATFIATTAAGAASLVAGGALALAGGDYISYNSDKHTFINTTGGNDVTEMYIGQIHAAEDGALPLRINDSGRGVELANVNSMTMTTQLAGVSDWTNVFYSIGSKVRIVGFIPTYYNALVYNRDTFPTIPIPDWVSGQQYDVNIIVFSAGLVYRCLDLVTSSTPPASDPTKWESLGFTTNAISNIWQVYSPSVANITGDDVSNITIGTITPPVDFVRLAGDGLVGTTGLQEIANIQTITLTTTIFSAWSVATPYADGAEVEYDDANRVSQFAGNLGNIPDATLQNWVSGDGYDVGNVRYYATNNKAYLCNTAITIGTTTPPPSDAKWTEFQVGNNGEDVWFSTTAPVVSTITGDRLSVLEMGNITCVGDVGSYLEITANPDPEKSADALIQSAGAIGIVGNTGLIVLALNDDINIQTAVGDVVLQGKNDVLLASDEGNVEFSAPSGQAIISCAGNNGITSTGADVSLTAFTNVNITAGAGSNVLVNSTLDFNSNDVIDARTITGAGALTLATTGATNLSLSPDTGGLIVATKGVNLSSNNITNANTITGAGALTLATTGATNLNLSPDTGGLIVANKGLNLSNNNITNANTITGQGALTLATTGATNLNLSPDTGGLIVANKGLNLSNNNITNANTITGQTTLTLENVVAVNTATASDNITINTYYPLLRIYKNETIGSAVSRAANTAEVQVYPQTMTLKANTQYLLNMSYAGLTENVSTATPNNNYYIIYRIHQGTTPLTTANLWGLAQQFNSTAQAGGVSVSFMTTTAGTYTGRFYIRNQNATVALTIANISATITEVF